MRSLSGNQILKDNYASMLGLNYELRAPDYSYMVITEIQDFYYQKFKKYEMCKRKTIKAMQTLRQFLQHFHQQATAIQSTIQNLVHGSTEARYIHLL
jgi:glutathionyl-hydroquinone reductase